MSDYPPPPGEHPPGPEPPPPPPPPGGEAAGAETLPERSLGDILRGAWEIYTKNAGQLLLIVALIVVPLTVLSYLLTDVVFDPGTRTETIAGQRIEIAESRSFFIFLLVVLVAAAIGVITTALLQAALLRGAALASIGDPVDIGQSYRYGLRRFGSVLWVSILVGLSVAIGLLLLVIPGIILLAFFAVSIPALIVEDVRGTGAMRRSWQLVSGHFWHVLGVVVVAFIITAVIGGLIGAIGGGNRVLGVIFSAIGQIIVAPYSALVTVLLYLDVRARSESLTASTLRSELGTTG
jgi:hypothetical protein